MAKDGGDRPIGWAFVNSFGRCSRGPDDSNLWFISRAAESLKLPHSCRALWQFTAPLPCRSGVVGFGISIIYVSMH